MPEMPEVETVMADLRRAGLAGRRIEKVCVTWPRLLSGMEPERFCAQLTGRRFKRLGRRAKFLTFELDDGQWLLVHLRMSGQFRLSTPSAPTDPHEHIRLLLDNGRELRFHDTRKFGRWRLTQNPAQTLNALGPEPLDPKLTAQAFERRIRAHHRRLKPLLLDQTFLAGLGNIYADEALWLARLHPHRASHRLRPAESRRLFRAIRRVLREAISRGGTTLGLGEGHFNRPGREEHGAYWERRRVYQRAGAPCRRCGAIIRRIIVNQRSTHICPRCQPTPPAPLTPAQLEGARWPHGRQSRGAPTGA